MDVAILDTRIGFPIPSLNVVFDYFSSFLPKMCKIYLKCTLDATFLDCFALRLCDVIGELLLEWACLALQGWTTFHLTSKLADIPVSKVRKGNPIPVSLIYSQRWGLPSRGCYKPWSWGWDSLDPSAMWWLIIFLLCLSFNKLNTVYPFIYVQIEYCLDTPPCSHVILLETLWCQNILGTKSAKWLS